MMFLDCPAYLDQDSVRCGLPAEVRCRFTMRSTDGPLESAMIWCPAGHYFNGPIEFLARDSTGHYDPGTAGLGHDGRYGGGGFALRAFPAAPERKVRRPNTAPAYYLGHPATLWITALRPRHRAAASRYLMEAVGGQSLARDPEAAEWVSLRADKGQRASCGPARTPGPWV